MVNYIVCLAHFCELHGPSMVICTQMTHDSNINNLSLDQSSQSQRCASCELKLPDGGMNLITKPDKESNSKSISYISTSYPTSRPRYTALTKLVMKSLSVETTTDLFKPIFFGDDTNGYCISMIFKIKDSRARGSERKYSLILVCDTESELLHHWNVVGTYFLELIESIQSKVEEQIRKGPKGLGSDGVAQFDNEQFLRRSLIKPMSLVDLTGDEQIFVRIHLWSIALLHDILY